MRKIVLSTNVTLDGFMCGLNGELGWHFAHWNDEMASVAFEQLKTMDAFLVGRATYESMANHFPTAATHPETKQKDAEFAQLMNALEKIVFSRTLQKAEWNNSRIISDNVPEEVAKLKERPGKDMIMWGGVGIVSSFIQQGLIDEFRIWVAPVVLGSGIPLFKEAPPRALTLLESKAFSNGVVLLRYQPR